METKHTPGPWVERRISKHNEDFRAIEGGGGYFVERGIPGFSVSGEIRPIDARLIAAAPDMLQLLRVCSAAFKADGFTEQNKRDTANLVDAMISFAEGGAE